MKKLFRKLFPKKPKLSFLETHKYRIRLYDTCYFIEVKGAKYHSWTTLDNVLRDRKLSPIYKDEKIEHCIHKDHGIDCATRELKRFCEYIVEWERGNVNPSEPIEGDLKEFYIIENL